MNTNAKIVHSIELFKARTSSPAEPDKAQKLEEDMLKHYLIMRYGARRFDSKSAPLDSSVIADLREFAGKPLWEWTEELFELWCQDELFLTRKLRSNSQRKYQGIIKDYLKYLEGNATFQGIVSREFGCKIRQICTKDNCIPHILKKEGDSTPAMSHEQMECFFETIQDMITDARSFNGKDLFPLLRDKALFQTIYIFGLRIDECCSADTGSFRTSAALPELGKFGSLFVVGKGSRGSGPKPRTVQLHHPPYLEIIQWYLGTIWPEFAKNAKNPNDDALFFSERGVRISGSAIRYSFDKILQKAGLHGNGFTPHSLRSSYATHTSMTHSLETVQSQLGHNYPTTTLDYISLPKEFVTKDIQRSVRKQINIAEQGRNDER